jgi:SpoVK/Ycf46/Vps4 family AAA+-type ATPase
MRQRQSPANEGFGLGQEILSGLCGSLPQLIICRALKVTGLAGGMEVASRLSRQGEADALPLLYTRLGITPEPVEAEFEDLVAARCRALESSPPEGGVLLANLRLIGREAGLEETEVLVLFIRIAARLDGILHAAIRDLLLDCIDPVMHLNLDALLGASPGTSARLLQPTAALAQSGLLLAAPGRAGPLEARLVLPQGLMTLLLEPLASAADAIAHLVPRARRGELELSDFAHLETDVRMLRLVLADALDARRVGVNVLLHGPPGVGKTELADVLARELGANLFAVPGHSGGESRSPVERLNQYRMVQGLIRSSGRSLVLLDEIEDLFPFAPWDRENLPSKALVNDTLETNLTPTLWLSNRISHMDRAYLRRFDMVMEIKAPGRDAKKALLCRMLPELRENEAFLTEAVSDHRLSPATLVRMGRVVASMKPASGPEAAASFGQLRRHYLSAIGRPSEALPANASSMGSFDLSWLNPDVDLMQVTARLRHAPGARILLHGPPGTGKTRFAHHLGQERGVMVLAKSASDLLSPYVGETEERLRGMFEEAARDGDLLLLDEADSFLSTREAGQPRWQSTQTNELLTSMERFQGVFVCTTNRLDQLDPAVLRRFDLKVGFAPPRPNQRERMVAWLFGEMGLAWDEAQRQALGGMASRLSGLVPGDIATAARKLRLVSDRPRAQDVLLALEEECGYRNGHRRPIGFMSH